MPAQATHRVHNQNASARPSLLLSQHICHIMPEKYRPHYAWMVSIGHTMPGLVSIGQTMPGLRVPKSSQLQWKQQKYFQPHFVMALSSLLLGSRYNRGVHSLCTTYGFRKTRSSSFQVSSVRNRDHTALMKQMRNSSSTSFLRAWQRATKVSWSMRIHLGKGGATPQDCRSEKCVRHG